MRISNMHLKYCTALAVDIDTWERSLARRRWHAPRRWRCAPTGPGMYGTSAEIRRLCRILAEDATHAMLV